MPRGERSLYRLKEVRAERAPGGCAFCEILVSSLYLDIFLIQLSVCLSKIILWESLTRSYHAENLPAHVYKFSKLDIAITSDNIADSALTFPGMIRMEWPRLVDLD